MPLPFVFIKRTRAILRNNSVRDQSGYGLNRIGSGHPSRSAINRTRGVVKPFNLRPASQCSADFISDFRQTADYAS